MNDAKTPSSTPEWRDQDEGADAIADRTFAPSTPQVNRSREQGLGVGAKELNAPRDPDRVPNADPSGSDGAPQSDETAASTDSAASLDDSRDQFQGGDR